ncbi:glycosyltransferase [Chryseobacterium taiwanense]|uniref:Alpha-L-Rha alpha-1,3-L-rhamnosyltransferase n=1 Tax=Chryseobacterium taiwanense TaxID=363331 RepID=A0A0B4CQC8_9FLAO|nr:glycosyltransferase [Chryseobacterium taiwanense]KIC63449.1 alpha-L-Rha alpha-1,3-L-rhamnosyltransferase [Chryseobacterium taiwanense]
MIKESVSVCIATYNGQDYIKAQVDSILKQLNIDDEIIISDDGSTDDTLNIIKNYKDNRIKIFLNNKTNKKNAFGYVSKNFENAIINAKGNFIFLADQDDIWEDDKIQVCRKVLENNDLVLHDCRVVNKDNQELFSSYFKLNKSRQGILKNLVKNSYLGCCMAFRRSVLDFALPFPQKEVPHDIWLGLIAECFGKVQFLNKKLVGYRRHGNNLSASGERSSNNLFFKLKYRLIILTELLIRVVHIKSRLR